MDEEKEERGSPEAAGSKEKPVKPASGQAEGPSTPGRTPEKAKPPGRGQAAKAAKPRPPRRPLKKGPTYEEMEEDPLLGALKERFGERVVSGQIFLAQPIYTVTLDALFDTMLYLRDTPEWNFDYLVDLTALDYLGDEKRFCLVYHLYAYPSGPLIRVKARLAADEVAPSVTSIWKVADWLEREVYDLFGIEFSGHPNLKRILLPDDWHGHPLRKDYDIKLQDQTWIRKHLEIRKVPS
ncbi:MAG: NADH-quinone oxidoreductase subunit C [Acidobacteriota bacterium]